MLPDTRYNIKLKYTWYQSNYVIQCQDLIGWEEWLTDPCQLLSFNHSLNWSNIDQFTNNSFQDKISICRENKACIISIVIFWVQIIGSFEFKKIMWSAKFKIVKLFDQVSLFFNQVCRFVSLELKILQYFLSWCLTLCTFVKEARRADFVKDRAYSALVTLIGW